MHLPDLPVLAPVYVGGVQLGALAAHRQLPEGELRHFLRDCSTNVDQLAAGRWDTLLTSALVVEEPMPLPYVLLLLAVLGYAEYAYGAWWAAGVFLLGHTAASLLVYGGLRATGPDAATRSAVDVGTSYGFNAVLGALTAAVPRGPLRLAARAGLLVLGARPLLGRDRPTFTDVGHFAALALGIGLGAGLGTGRGAPAGGPRRTA
ncbi:rhomboid-like protein [Streptomyces sp. NPDC091272]|uniref:rhomboid-like protein n=1 Tax=Streptomyces sp. NPDC091272 TaxID=3365981 RepID=UPI00382CE3CE